jgi:hypothetical protein
MTDLGGPWESLWRPRSPARFTLEGEIAELVREVPKPSPPTLGGDIRRHGLTWAKDKLMDFAGGVLIWGLIRVPVLAFSFWCIAQMPPDWHRASAGEVLYFVLGILGVTRALSGIGYKGRPYEPYPD